VEQRQAARYSGYTWDEYVQLPGDPWCMDPQDTDCKADVVAFYRVEKRIAAIEDSVKYG